MVGKTKPDPLADVDPRYLEAFKRGALAPVHIQPLDYDTAVALRMRLYRLKSKLRASTSSDPPITLARDAAKLVTICLSNLGSGKFAVTLRPRDWGTKDAFANAGIDDALEAPPDLD